MSQDYGSDYSSNSGSKFALIVVLFILLIIVGASFMHKSY
ncbi:YjcZ family sporulation protein [Lysinibacillus sphaericus]|nr:YjcZ family sporulation protein [Lysinibacillus sphaericus]